MLNFQVKFKDYYRTNGKKRSPLQVYEEWCNIPQDYLNGITPGKYFEKIKDVKILVDMLKEYEDDIPPLLLRRIKDFDKDAIEALSELAMNIELSGNKFYCHGPINALYILGEMRNMEILPVFIKIIENRIETDAIFEYTADAIIKLGHTAIAPLIEAINSTSNEFARSHMSWILSRLGQDDKIFDLLCRLCQEGQVWKGYYAEILCDYGDKRAVPILQRLVCEHKFSYEEMDQIERSLVLLGGEWNWDYEEKGLPPLLVSRKEEKKEENLTKVLEPLQQRKLTGIRQEEQEEALPVKSNLTHKKKHRRVKKKNKK